MNTVFFFSCASLSCVICSKTGFHMLMCRKAVVGMPSSMFATINQIMQCRHRRRGYDETHCWVRQTQRRGVGFPYILNSIYPAFISVKFRKRKRGYEARRRMIVQCIYIYIRPFGRLFESNLLCRCTSRQVWWSASLIRTIVQQHNIIWAYIGR